MTARYEIIDCEQGSPEWFEARRGLTTASRFSDVLAEGKLIMRGKYMRQLAGEIITEEVMETYSNDKMDRGKKHEPDLRARYQFDHDVNVDKIGFIKMNPSLYRIGCSPDGFVGEKGMVEFKSTEPHLLIEILETGKVPNHLPQVQGNLWITGRLWCDLVIGWPKLPLSITHITRDEGYIANLQHHIRVFNAELDAMVGRTRGR